MMPRTKQTARKQRSQLPLARVRPPAAAVMEQLRHQAGNILLVPRRAPVQSLRCSGQEAAARVRAAVTGGESSRTADSETSDLSDVEPDSPPPAPACPPGYQPETSPISSAEEETDPIVINDSPPASPPVGAQAGATLTTCSK